MNTTPPRPTPETDALTVVCYGEGGIEASYGFRAVPIKDCRKLERERNEVREQIQAMREAIEDAHYALAYVYNDGEGSCAFPFRTDDDLCSENRFHHVKDALDALKPLLND